MTNKKINEETRKVCRSHGVSRLQSDEVCALWQGMRILRVAATRLLSHPEYAHVQEKIRQFKAIQRTKNEITYEGIAKKLGEIRDVALADGSYGPAVTAEIARAKLAGLMVDRKELKIHKIDNMSRDQLEIRLQQLVQEHQIVLGSAEEVEEVEEELFQIRKSLENHLGQEIVEEALLDDEEDLSEASASHQQEDDLLEE